MADKQISGNEPGKGSKEICPEPVLESKGISGIASAPAAVQPPKYADNLKTASEVIRGARAATDKERKMTLLQGIRLYPKAIAWSMLISTCIAMEGYDISLVNNFCQCNPLSSPSLPRRRKH